MAARLAGLALRSPGLVLALLVGATLVAGLGTPRLRSVSYLEGHLPADDPELARFQRLQAEFGSDRVAIAAFGCDRARPCGDVLDPDVLSLVEDLTASARAAPGVVDVASLTTARILTGDGATLRAERIVPGTAGAERQRLRGLLLADPLLPGTIVSPDLQTTAIVVRFDPSEPDSERNASLLALVDAMSQRAERAGFTLHVTGDVTFAALTDRYVREDLSTLTPVMLALIVALLAWIFRSASATLLALGTVALPSVWAFGAMGWLGRPLTPVVTTLPVLVLVVGITDAIHYLVRVHDLAGSIPERRELVRIVAREVGPPTTVAAVTSALGFLSFLAGPLPALRDFGVFAAVGILGAWFATFTLIPIAVASARVRLPTATPAPFVYGDRLLSAVHQGAHRRAPWVVAAAFAVALVSAVGISRLVAENDGFKLVGEGDPLTLADRFVRERLRGAGSLELVFEPPAGESLLEPETLERLGEAEQQILRQPRFGPAVSILPILRVANRALAGTSALPESRAAAEQLVLLAEAADGEGVRRVLTPDHAVARISVGSRLGDIGRVAEIIDELRVSLGRELDGHGQWTLTGALLLMLHQGDLVLQSQIASFSTAFVTIFFVLLWFIRSFALGGLGMVPNVLPVVAVLGYMGFAGINLDVGTAMIASIVLGVSVDDTAYFLIHYRRARRGGATVRDATAFTFAVAGKPALFSAAMLAAGFFVLGLSSFQSLAIFGLLSGVTVLAAVVIEVSVLPALLELTAARREEG